MSYSELNEKLVESFGELEKMCNFVYDENHGVTCYIKELDSRVLSREELSILKSLKAVRRKRNKLSHGEVLFSEECATEEDIEFIEEFMKSITKGSDPLSLYFPDSKSHSKKDSEESQNSDAALIGGGVLLVVVVIALVCLVVATIGKYIH